MFESVFLFIYLFFHGCVSNVIQTMGKILMKLWTAHLHFGLVNFKDLLTHEPESALSMAEFHDTSVT